MVIWFTGMSGAGKSTLAKALFSDLKNSKYLVHHLDGDVFRNNNENTSTFNKKNILMNNLLIVQNCKKIITEYDFVLVSVICPYEESRNYARKIFGSGLYYEIFVDCPIEELIRRDTKGLYKKAIKNEIDVIGFSRKLQ